MSTGKDPATMSPGREFVISREFAAPREAVFRAWTDPERLKKWWGPKGFSVLACTVDLRPGGVFHYSIRSPEGQVIWGKWVFREVDPPVRLVFVSAFSDEQGGTTRHPFVPEWPETTLSTLTLTESAGGTTVTLRGGPVNATEAERRTFESWLDGMSNGWSGTLDQLAAHLAAG
jgi:uncharacterized protein YndB with AHSA1/START domain